MLDLVFGTYKRTDKEWIDVNDARYKKEMVALGGGIDVGLSKNHIIKSSYCVQESGETPRFSVRRWHPMVTL